MSDSLKLAIRVAGSSGDPYTVTVIKDGPVFSLNCTCQAGQMGQYCKHRISLLEGDLTHVAQEDKASAAAVPGMLKGSHLESHFQIVTREEAGLDAAKRRLAEAKRRMAAAMRTGM